MNVAEIKATINIMDILHSYGFAVDCKNNIVCPFHKEKTGSLKVYPKNNTWHCFGCGAGNDVIDFVMKMENISFTDAKKRLGGEDMAENQKAIVKQRIQLQSQKEKQRKAIEAEYGKILSEYIRLDKNRTKYKPLGHTETLHPLFVEAIKKIGYQEHLLDYIENRRWNFEHGYIDSSVHTGK